MARPQVRYRSHHRGLAIPEKLFLSVMAALELGEGRARRIEVHGIGDETSAALHLRHSGLEDPTDVLAFDYGDVDEIGSDEEALEGEVFVNLDLAAREAHERGHDPVTEALFYAVHGVLHLFGYDDHTDAGRAEMFRLQFRYLAACGLTLGD